jgi:hypothetical protein
MLRSNQRSCFLLALVSFLMPLQASAQTRDMPRPPPPIAETVGNYLSFVWMLTTPIDATIFQRKELTFRDSLELLMEEMAKKKLDVPVMVDRGSFKEADSDVDIYKTPVKIPPSPRKRAAGTILRQILDQAPRKDAVLLIRYSYIEITHKRRVSLATWLEQFTDPNGGGIIGAKQKRVE